MSEKPPFIEITIHDESIQEGSYTYAQTLYKPGKYHGWSEATLREVLDNDAFLLRQLTWMGVRVAEKLRQEVKGG